MNSRRSFFRQLAVSLVAISAPTIFVPKLVKPIWKSVAFAEPSLEQFNHLPYYAARIQIHRNADWIAWSQLLSATKWEPNMGSIIRSIESPACSSRVNANT